MPLDPVDPNNPTNNLAFARWNPYKNIGNTNDKTVRQVIIELGQKLERNEVTDEELVSFLTQHRVLFDNTRTGMLSSWFLEELDSYPRAKFVCFVSCSCECGPMDDPCNQLGPGSKIDFSFKGK